MARFKKDKEPQADHYSRKGQGMENKHADL
jgi:hypothetical protein